MDTVSSYNDFVAGSLGLATTYYTGQYNVIKLNAAGVAHVQSLLGSKVYFCIRDSVYDYADIEPIGSYYSDAYFTTVGYEAKLELVYDRDNSRQQAIII